MMFPTPEMIEAARNVLYANGGARPLIPDSYVEEALTAALALLPGAPVGWIWKLPDGEEWQYRDRSKRPDSLGLPKATAARVILQPVYAAPAQLPVAVKAIDRQKAADAAVKANHAYGQWMPEHWLHLFLDAYEGKL